MVVLKSVKAFQKYRAFLKKNASKKTASKKNVGFVPTMGALHEGHLQLVRKSRSQCAHTIVSIFVNPTQFNNPEDFAKYPQTLKEDLKLLKEAGVSAVFLPNQKMMYPDGFRFQVTEKTESKVLCGAHRPGHFEGVLTVVLKLLNLTQPDKAFFGEKDFQQLKLIRDMAQAFFLKCKIVPVKTVREKSGLAMSSRNRRLNEQAQERALLISKLLKNKKLSVSQIQKQLTQAGMQVDYVEDQWKRRFVAAHLEGVRLIDNMPL
jgi:pantoate--beta-alanine ligase